MRIRCGVETATTHRKWEPKKTASVFERETGDENESDNARTPRSVQNVAAEVKSYTLVLVCYLCTLLKGRIRFLYRERVHPTVRKMLINQKHQALHSLCIVMFYMLVLSPMCHHQRSLESGVSEIKNSYRSVKTVRSSHSAFSPNPYSEPNVASTRIEDAREPVSLNMCTKKVPSAAVDVGVRHAPIVEKSNPGCLTMEEEEKYDSCREDMSTDSQMQEKRGNPVSDTEDDSNYVASGGRRQHKISSKIRGVYTPDARLKGLFESEKKVEYRPIAKTNRAVYKNFSEILSENLAQIFKIKTSHLVTNSFFLDIANPGK
ncbi:hypothetical protein Bca4012_025920 [Brassica carinata]|uniref:Uncharacterized protein n=1 Tax=Brassica carinata TaxID=52824 RepID=A0A8X8ATS7_BRACI|nr:hypothetical protein Bca52824_022949 [Brassica carinata]